MLLVLQLFPFIGSYLLVSLVDGPPAADCGKVRQVNETESNHNDFVWCRYLADHSQELFVETAYTAT